MEERPPLSIIAATRNPAKLREFQRVVGDLAVIEPIPHDISQLAWEVELFEEADDSATIAEQKALAWSRAISNNRIVMASDGGLIIPALGSGWNPARTRRFAGPEATDVQRVQQLLELTSYLRAGQRAIGWQESIGIACDCQVVYCATARSNEGVLATEVDPPLVEATGGFWVSALWRCPEYGGRLLVDLTLEEQEQRLDHWRALRAPVQKWLADFLVEQTHDSN